MCPVDLVEESWAGTSNFASGPFDAEVHVRTGVGLSGPSVLSSILGWLFVGATSATATATTAARSATAHP